MLFFALSLILTLLFFIYGFNQYFLLNAARSYRIPDPPEHSRVRPTVSIQLPVYNERYVIRRLVTACAVMVEAYGKEKASILLLDDSDDDTVLEVDKVVEEYREKQYRIEVLRRGSRAGYKAGALQAARVGAMFEGISSESESNHLDNSMALLGDLRAAARNLERMLEAELSA